MFVTLEGLDGSGKTTQAELLAAALRSEGGEVVATREPGGTPLGERLRAVLLHDADISPWAEAALFAAARAELVQLVLAPALRRAAVVVCDRYLDSSLAYQGVARGLGIEPVLELNRLPTQGLLPDLTFLLLVEPGEAERRAGPVPDRIEREAAGFRARVDRGYRELAGRFPERIVSLDGGEPPERLAERIHGRVRAHS